MTPKRPLEALLIALFALPSCAMSDSADAPAAARTTYVGGRGSTIATGGSASYMNIQGGAASEPEIPPEQKNAPFEAPVVTKTLLWSTNPQSGRVAVMDAISLEMKIYDAGFTPKYLVGVPNADAPSAIVLNTGSHDATWLRLPNGLGGDVVSETIRTHQGANTCTVSPSGCWAIAWTDVRLVVGAQITQQFQDATVIDLCGTSGQRVTGLGTLGKRPSSVSFDQGEQRALVVTSEGISVIELTGGLPRAGHNLFFEDDTAARDVAITPDGHLALVRREGTTSIDAIDLTTWEASQINLATVVTDLDLLPDGSMALAVLRDRAEVVLLGLPAAGTELTETTIAVPGEFFGSAALADDGSAAVLYTTALAYDHVTALTLGQDSAATSRTWSLKAPVTSMFMAPDARHALAFLGVSASSTAKGAFAVIPAQAAISPKIVSLAAPPQAVAMAPAPTTDRALVTMRDDANQAYGVYVVKLPSLETDLLKLASPPVAAGIVPAARKGYVAQAHAEGRITVIDLDQGTTQTITGFELAAKVRYSE